MPARKTATPAATQAAVRKKGPTRLRKAGTGSRKAKTSTASAEAVSNHQTRIAIARFVEHNVADLQPWLDQIAREDGPKAAFDRLLHVMEYHMPKLARGEVEGNVEANLTIVELQRF
ncbi:MAG: hypothetical protein HY255_08910 [Betaproteobacteria bacterium]|nr:hypothetical protein [Betaproteobacteria bacterium]